MIEPIDFDIIDVHEPLNRECDFARGLVGFWLPLPHNEGGGTLRDLAGRNHGTLTNGPTWVGGQNGLKALYADGFSSPSQHVALSLTPTSVYSIAVLLRIADSVDGGCWIYGNSSGGHVLYCRPGSSVFRVQYQGGAFPTQNSTVTPTAGVLYRVVVTCAGSSAGDVKIYVNGVDSTSGTTALTSPTGTSASFPRGAAFSGQKMFMYSAALWSRVLSASEVTGDYAESLSGHPTLINRLSRRTGYAQAVTTNEGTASVTVSTTVSSAGELRIDSAAAPSVYATLASAGTLAIDASASPSVSCSIASPGELAIAASVVASVSTTVAAAATLAIAGTALPTITTTTASAGENPVQGASANSVTTTITAIGSNGAIEGTASLAIDCTASGAGALSVGGTAAPQVETTAACSGTLSVNATASPSVTCFISVAGTSPIAGSASLAISTTVSARSGGVSRLLALRRRYANA